jgi:hypothetical protein
MTHTPFEQETQDSSLPAKGSIAWAMNRGKLFQVDGMYPCGQLMTHSETAQEAARHCLYRGATYSVWVPTGTKLKVWNVYAGSIGGFSMKDAEEFVVVRGEVEA